MNKGFAKMALSAIVVGIVMMAFSATPARAQDEHGAAAPAAGFLDAKGAGKLGGAIGAGLVLMGGAAGIGRIGGSAVESMARQPEVAGQISTGMIITAAMIEGATLFGVVVGLLAVLLQNEFPRRRVISGRAGALDSVIWRGGDLAMCRGHTIAMLYDCE